MKEIRILFTGVGRRVELVQAFKQAALCLNIPLKIFGADMTGTAPSLAYCDFTRKVCGMRESNYVSELLKICEEDKIDLLIPTIDTDLLVLSENSSLFKNTKIMISNPDMIQICRDKTKTSQFFWDCGLKAPIPTNDWKKYNGGYPAFIKPKNGSSSINAFKIKDEEDLKIHAAQIGDYIVQPYIDGTEYTIDIFCDWNGEPVSIVPRRRLSVRAGEVLKTQIALDKKMHEEMMRLCKCFKPCGPITVQLIKDTKKGDNYYIEINPRFGGGAPLSMKSGANSAIFILQLLSGTTPKLKLDEVADGAIFSRFDQSVCTNIKVYNGKLKGVIFDLDDTLYSEKEYVRSGFKAVAGYLDQPEAFSQLWNSFLCGKQAIDEYLLSIGKMELKEHCLKIYRNHTPVIKLYDDMYERLQNYREQGLKIGIITDGRPEGQRNKIRALHLEDLVDDIIITDELGGKQFRKPCDIAFRIFLTKWRLQASETLYIGDNMAKDFQACKQLGIRYEWKENKNGLYWGINENTNFD